MKKSENKTKEFKKSLNLSKLIRIEKCSNTKTNSRRSVRISIHANVRSKRELKTLNQNKLP